MVSASSSTPEVHLGVPLQALPRQEPARGLLLGRLRLMTFARVLIVGVLLGTTAMVEQADPLNETLPADFFLLVVGSMVLGLSLLYALLLRVLTSVHRLRQLAYVQLGGDAAFAGALVLLTGGTSSSFTFFFSVTILLAAVVLFRSGALFQATCCSLLFISIGLAETLGAGAAVGLTSLSDAAALSTGFEGERAGFMGGMVYKLINNVLAFYALAFLASHLAESLRRRDVQLEETEDSLEKLSALHDNIIASIPAGVLTTNSTGVITYFNPRAVDITGIPAAAAEGRGAAETFVVLLEPMSQLNGTHPVTASSTLLQDDGTKRHLQWQVSPLSSPNGSPIGHLVTFQDVTNVREMEDQVRTAARFASIGRLAASIAHEIRNPLTSISGSIQLLRQTLEVDAHNARLMNIVSNETDALNKWITDFLLYARPRLSQPVPLNLRALLDDTVIAMQHDQVHNVELSVAGPDQVMTMADPIYLRQAIWNVLANAVQASPVDCTVTCSLSRLDDPANPLVRLSITDRGPGIDASVRDRIFDPFVTTKDRGTGLGLATAYRVVIEHGGRLSFESREERETTFHIDLPAVENPTVTNDKDIKRA